MIIWCKIQVLINPFLLGPGMGAPLASVAVVARTIAKLWNKPILGNYNFLLFSIKKNIQSYSKIAQRKQVKIILYE